MSSTKLNIPESVKTKYPNLVNLILETKSMDDDERQYWFNILPIMKEEQVEKLRNILKTEKNKIAQIDSQYSNVNEPKAASNFDKEEFIKNKNELRAAEAAHEEAEEELEDKLLEEIENI
jgi:hypothetical protein